VSIKRRIAIKGNLKLQNLTSKAIVPRFMPLRAGTRRCLAIPGSCRTAVLGSVPNKVSIRQRIAKKSDKMFTTYNKQRNWAALSACASWHTSLPYIQGVYVHGAPQCFSSLGTGEAVLEFQGCLAHSRAIFSPFLPMKHNWVVGICVFWMTAPDRFCGFG
jgi:hypothetical protein